jgi:type I restriction enzyme, R subunit
MEINIMDSQNYEFLRSTWPELASLGGFAEQYSKNDPNGSVVKLRAYAERIVDVIYSELTLPKAPASKFMELLANEAFVAVTPTVVVDKLHAVRIHGNKAAHGDKCSVNTANWLLREAWDLGRWLAVTYNHKDKDQIPAFEAPVFTDSKGQLKREKKVLLEKYSKQEAQMRVLLEDFEKERYQRIEAEKTVEELEQAYTRANQVANDFHFDELTTRRRLIDTQLANVGWSIGVDGSNTEEITQEEEIKHQPTTSGLGYADYVLWDINGLPLAVIEAKKTAVDAEKGRHQAKIYADGLEREHGQRPVIFYTNGHDIWIWDDAKEQHYPPRKLYGFYSKKSLQYKIRQRREKKSLNTISPKKEILTDRLYQHEALKRVCERFEDKQRKALVVQATGTGKTRLSIAITDVLMNASWVKRVLFLCDRRELRKQAKNAYGEFLKAPIAVLTTKTAQEDSNRIFVATYPAMIKVFHQFDPGFFDLIIADESHRSIYNIYGDIFKYFDSLQVGLTATPVEMVSRSTCKLFSCDFKEPTSNYSLERAVEEGYLVPYHVVKYTTKFLREGIKGSVLTPEELVELEDQGIDPNTLDFDSKDIDRSIFNKDTNRKILQNLMNNGIRQADEQTLGKSIVFARNHKHAKLLEQLFDEMYPQYGGKFCQVIDHYDPRSDELIDDFRGDGGNKTLTIAISVDMLDTGIDIPEIVNLVFAKPVKSPVKFWQMLGRGTRLCENLFGAGKHKTHFQVFDHWGVVEYHGLKQREVEINPNKSPMQRLFESRIALAKSAIEKAEVEVFELLAQWITTAINTLDENTIAVKEKWKLKRQLGDLEIIRQFAPNTVVLLETEMAPLMQWVDVRDHTEAYQFDLLITQLQLTKLADSAAYMDCRGDIINWLNSLQMNLNQVRNKASLIQQVRETSFWDNASLSEIEDMRVQLRDIMKFRDNPLGPDFEAPVIDLTDSHEQSEHQSTYLNEVDMVAYRKKVEAALKELFDTDPVLRKIRKGEPVTEQELKSLNALVHTHHPDVDLNTLKAFYESAGSLEQVLRSIVGMDAEVVNQRFTEFIQAYPSLTSKQIQFLGLLKRQIAQSGSIELDKLYEMPFVALGDLDALFDDEHQIESLLAIVKSFDSDPSRKESPIL